MTTTQAAKVLGMTRQNVIDRCTRGTIKAKKIKSPNARGFYWNIKESEVQRVMEARK